MASPSHTTPELHAPRAQVRTQLGPPPAPCLQLVAQCLLYSITVWMSCPTGLFFILWLFSATQPNKVKCLRCFSVPCDCAIRRRTAYPGRLPVGSGSPQPCLFFGSLWLSSGPAYLHHLVRSFVTTTVSLCTDTLSTESPKSQHLPSLGRPPEKIRLGVWGGSSTSVRTDLAGLCVGEAAGKPVSSAALL